MIELVKKYKLVTVFIIVILANISWYFIGSFREQSIAINLNEPNNHLEETVPLEEQDDLQEESVMIHAVESINRYNTNELEGSMPADKDKSSVKVPIYICGAVVQPGVYYVEQTAIINDAITLCGGFEPEANQNYLNLANPITAHQKIYVPKIGEEIDKSFNSYENDNEDLIDQREISSQSQADSSININLANNVQLQTLPGIGSVKAKAIIDYRNRNSGFKTVDELLNVPGIGEKTLDKIKNSVTI